MCNIYKYIYIMEICSETQTTRVTIKILDLLSYSECYAYSYFKELFLLINSFILGPLMPTGNTSRMAKESLAPLFIPNAFRTTKFCLNVSSTSTAIHP